MKTLLNSIVIALALAMGSAQAAVIFDLNSVVRPGGGTANTILVGTTNIAPAPNTTMVISSGSMALSAKNGSFVTYFTPQNLAVGETIKVQYAGTFTNADASGNGFRVGLFDYATGTKYTTDQASVSTIFTNYQGYGYTARETGTTASGSAFQRGPTTSLLSNASALQIFSSTVPALNIVDGTAYSGYFSITRTDAVTLNLEFKFGNQAIQSFTDNSGIITTYNTFSIYLNNTITGLATPTTFTMTQMDISVVPEPSVLHLLIPAFALGAIVFVRRRKTARSSA